MIRPFAVAGLLAQLCTGTAHAQRPSVAITHVNVVDVARATIARDMTVLITDSIVTAVAPSPKIEVPPEAQIIDGRGKYLMPGLFDMHTHVSGDAELKQMLDFGVTTTRNMGGTPGTLLKQRRLVQERSLTGPLMLTGGPLLAGSSADNSWAVLTPAAALQAVDSLHALHVDFVKVHEGLPRAAYYAIMKRAREHNLPVVGHVPAGITPTEVSAAGQKSIEHLEFVPDHCLMIFDVARRAAVTAPPSGCTLAAFDSLFRRFAKNGTHLTPTIGSFRVWVKPDHFNAIFAAFRELVPLMRKHHVGILAGTDNGNTGIVPGKSLHEEMALLVKAGFTHREALQAATVNAARFLAQPDSLSLIRPRAVANLLLIRGDPLQDVTNASKIDAVILQGELRR